MRAILSSITIMALAAIAGADDKPGKVDGQKLIGKWEPKEAKKDTKLLVEFTKAGKLNITSTGGGKEFKVEGTYTLDGDKLAMNLKFGGSEVNEIVTITKLTDDVLEGQGEKGKKSFSRFKAQ